MAQRGKPQPTKSVDKVKAVSTHTLLSLHHIVGDLKTPDLPIL
jgi:hypothetical protein